MKSILIVLLSIIVLAAPGCRSSFDGVSNSRISDFEDELDVNSGNLYIYTSPAVPPLPSWYKSNDNIDLSDLVEEEDESKYFLIKAAGNYTQKATDDNGIEGANKIAWANARKKLYDSWIEVFNANSQVVGSSADSRISQEESFYKFISSDLKGVSPLSELKTFYACESKSRCYTCYGLYIVRVEELNRRISLIRDQEEREKYEVIVNKFMEKYRKDKF